MRAYLDTSAVVPLVTQDALETRALKFLREKKPVIFISDFGAAEFTSVVARRFRTKTLTPNEAMAAFAKFDFWRLRTAQVIELQPNDLRTAESFMRRLDLTLLTPDALHLAIVLRTGLTLVTFDTKMAASAQTLGIPIASA